MLLGKPSTNCIAFAMIVALAIQLKIAYGSSEISTEQENRYGDNPKSALMHVVGILLHGDAIEDVQKHMDEFYAILGAPKLVINRETFADRELVNVYLVHHIAHGTVQSNSYDYQDVINYDFSFMRKVAHKNQVVVKKLAAIRDIFESRNEKELMEEMSRDFRTVKSALEKKDRTAIETQSVSDKLESFIDLMLIAAVKGRIRDFVPQYELFILFELLKREHIENDMSHDWMKKYRLMKKYFLTEMSFGRTMESIHECTVNKVHNDKIKKPEERWAALESDNDENAFKSADEGQHSSNSADDGWCTTFLFNARIVHWDANREKTPYDMKSLHNLIIGTIFSAIGHAHANPAIITAQAQWYSEMYVLDALARHSKHISQLNKHTLQQTEYNAARKDVEKLLIDQPNADINEAKRFKLKVARLYAMVTDTTSLEQVSTEFTTLIDEVIEICRTTYLDDVTQQMLHSIEIAIIKGNHYHQPEKYKQSSEMFKGTFEMVQDIYEKMRQINQKGIWKKLLKDLYTHFGAERTKKIKYFYLFAINIEEPDYSHVHRDFRLNGLYIQRPVIHGILEQHEILKETELLDHSPELHLMTQQSNTQLMQQLHMLDYCIFNREAGDQYVE